MDGRCWQDRFDTAMDDRTDRQHGFCIFCRIVDIQPGAEPVLIGDRIELLYHVFTLEAMLNGKRIDISYFEE